MHLLGHRARRASPMQVKHTLSGPEHCQALGTVQGSLCTLCRKSKGTTCLRCCIEHKLPCQRCWSVCAGSRSLMQPYVVTAESCVVMQYAWYWWLVNSKKVHNFCRYNSPVDLTIITWCGADLGFQSLMAKWLPELSWIYSNHFPPVCWNVSAVQGAKGECRLETYVMNMPSGTTAGSKQFEWLQSHKAAATRHWCSVLMPQGQCMFELIIECCDCQSSQSFQS